MIKFLGELGVDPKLLIAQILNFSLLVWILTKFLYRPMVKLIEKDEKELKEAERQKKALALEKEKLERQKKEQEIILQEKVEKTLIEAKAIARKIKQTAKLESQQERQALLKQLKQQFVARNNAIEKEVHFKVQKMFEARLQRGLKQIITGVVQRELQNFFFEQLLAKLKSLSNKELVNFQLSQSLKKNTPAHTKAKVPPSRHMPISSPFVLETACPLAEKQRREILMLLTKKVEHSIQMTIKLNPGLIAGYRLELLGTLIESNLLEFLGNNNSVNH